MIRWFTYPFSFGHNIKDRKELVDKGCLDHHDHENAILKVGVHGEKWIDFKTIKAKVLEILYEEVEDENYISFGLADTEDIVNNLGTSVSGALQRHVTVVLQETNKYSIEETFAWKG